MKRLYVANISWGSNPQTLRAFFEKVGTVSSADIVMDRATNRSRGFGFVEMENEADAQKAVDTLNGQELDGRQLKVQIAKDREERA